MEVHDVVELADTLPEYLESFVGESGCVLEYNFIEDFRILLFFMQCCSS